MTGFRWCAWAGALGAVLLASGCASVTHGTTQTVRVDTLTPDGEVVQGADCRFTNDKGSTTAPSGQSAKVRRSDANLMVQCTREGQPPARGQAISRVNAGMVGNVMIGGLVGAAIDSGTGAGYNYPSWMKLVFGEVRDFDRRDQTGDDAVLGQRIGDSNLANTAGTIPAAPPQDRPQAPAVAAAPPTSTTPPAPRPSPPIVAPPARTVELASVAPPRRDAPAPLAPTPVAADAPPFATTGIDDLRQLLQVNR